MSPVLRKNSLLIALDVPSPSCDNRQEQPPMPQKRDTLTMIQCTHLPRHLGQFAGTLLILLLDALRYFGLCLRPPAALAAENLFLGKQLALYRERDVRPRHATRAARLALIWLGRCFDWRQALAVVQPETFARWHRQGFRLFWRSTSCPGRPPIPADLQALIRRMGRDNPSWGEERIAHELWLKLGLRVSPRTVRKYLPKPPGRMRRPRMPTQR
jgi:hypothetical protein